MSELETDEHGRPEPPYRGDEVATLRGFLDFQRATLAWKCHGLSDEQLRMALPPTSMTLGGLLKHMALVEDSWFTEVVAGQPPPSRGPASTGGPTATGSGTPRRTTPVKTCGRCGPRGSGAPGRWSTPSSPEAGW